MAEPLGKALTYDATKPGFTQGPEDTHLSRQDCQMRIDDGLTGMQAGGAQLL